MNVPTAMLKRNNENLCNNLAFCILHALVASQTLYWLQSRYTLTPNMSAIRYELHLGLSIIPVKTIHTRSLLDASKKLCSGKCNN